MTNAADAIRDLYLAWRAWECSVEGVDDDETMSELEAAIVRAVGLGEEMTRTEAPCP
jgi:hypothetical protein